MLNQIKLDNPLQALLQAGNLRENSQRLEENASVLERMALLELEREGIRPGVITAQLNTVLVHAFGGPAHGQTTRVSDKAYADAAIKLVVGTDLFDYTPGVIFAIGNSIPCALVVPKVGGLGAMYAAAQKIGQDPETGVFDELSVAIARTLLSGVGYHPGLTYMPARQIGITARNPEIVLDHPAIINLQVA